MKLKLKILNKIVAFLVIACFFATSVCRDAIAVMAIPTPDATQYNQIFTDFILPYSYGKINRSHFAGTDRVIINIQDLHCHPKVQKNISNIIEMFDNKYGVTNIYLEGAYGNVSTKLLTENIKDSKKKTEILNKILDTGKLTGAEYYSASTNKTEIIKGLEKKEPYLDNLKRFGDLLEKQDEIQVILKGIEESTKKVKKQYYTKIQYKIENLSNKYMSGEIRPEKYYKTLQKYTEKLGIDLTKYENIRTYMMLLSLQKRLNYKAIASQFRSFVAALKGNLPYETYKMLLDNTKDFKQTDKLYSYIIKLSRDYGLDLTVNFGELNKYFNYIELSQKINQLDLLKEQEKLTGEINTRFSDTVAQKEVVFLTHFEKYLKDYMSTKITSDDYEYYKANIETYKKLYNKHIDNKIFSLLKPYMDEVDTFYKINSDRNEYFTQNLFNGIETQKIKNIKEESKEINKIIENMGQVKRVDVVVTGGFHSRTVTEILQKQGISYIVITPNVKDGIVDAEKTYYQIAKEQKEIDFQTLATMPLVLRGKDVVIEVMLDTNNNIKRNEIVEIYGEDAVKNVENKIKKGESEFSAKEELKQLSIDLEKRRTEISKFLEFDDIDTEVLELITEVILTSLSSSKVNNLKKTDIDIVIEGVIKAINNEYQNNIFTKIINILTSNGRRSVELENIKDIIIQIMQNPFLDSFLEQAGKNYLGYDTQKGLYYEISLDQDSKKRIYLQDFEKITLLFLVSYEGQEDSPIEKTTKFLSYANNEDIMLFAEQADIFQKNFAKLEDVKELKPESVNIINSINTINEENTYKKKTYSVRNIQKAIQTAQANGANLSEEEISKIIEIIRINLLSKINDVKAEYRTQFLKDIQSLGRLYTEQNEIIIYIDNDSLNEGIDIGIGTEILKEIKKNKLVEEGKLNAGITKIKFVIDPSVKQNEKSIKELLGVFWNDNCCTVEPMVKNDIEAIKKKNYYDTRRTMIFEDRAISEIEKTLPYTILRQNYDEEGVIYLKGAQNRKGNKSELFNEKNNIVYIVSADIDGTLTAVSDSRLIFLTELEERMKNGEKVSLEERTKTFLLFNSLGYLDELKMPIAHRMQVCKDISENNETYIISGRNDGGKNIETTEQYFLQNGVPFNRLILKPLDKLQPTITKKDGKFEGFIIDEFEKRISRAEEIIKNSPGTVVVINVFDDRQDSVDFYKSKKEELEKNGVENIIINVFQPQPRGVFKAKLKAHLKDKYNKYDFKKPENIINLIEEINQVYNLQLTKEEISQIKLNIYRKQPIGSDIKNKETQEKLQLVLKIITDIQQSADNSYLSKIKDIWKDNYSNYGEIEDIQILTNGFQNKPPVKIKTVSGEEYFLQYVEEEHKGNERDDMTFEIENIAADKKLAVPIIKTKDGKLYVKYVEDETPGTPAQTYFVAVNKFNNGEFYNKNLENNSHNIKDIVISITNLIIDFDNELTKKIYNSNLTNKWSQHDDIIALNDENYRFQDNKTFEEKGKQLKKQLGYSDSIGTDKQIGQLFFIVDGDYNPKRAEDRLKILFKKENSQILKMAINSMENMFENYGKYNYNGLDKYIVCGDTNLANVVYDNKLNKTLFTNFKNAGRNYRAKAYSDFLADARYPQLFDVQNIKTIIQTAQAKGVNLTKEEIVQIVEFTRYYAISRIPYMLEKNKSRKDEYLTNLNALNADLIEELIKEAKLDAQYKPTLTAISITDEKTERLVRRLDDDITNKEETASNIMTAIGEIEKGNYEKEYSQYTEFYKESVFSKTKAGNNEPYSFGEFLYDLACNNSDVSLMLSELGEKINKGTVKKEDVLEVITDIHESSLIKRYRSMINDRSDYSDSDFIENILDFFSVRIEKSMIRQGMINQDNGKNEKINDLKLLIKVAREKDYIIIEDKDVKNTIRNIKPESYPKEIEEYVRLIKEDAIKYRFVPKGYDYKRKEQFNSYWDGNFNKKIREYFPVNKVYEYEQFKEFNRELDGFEGNLEKRERLVRRLSDYITNKEETARNVMIAIGEIEKGNYEKEYSQYTEFYKENVFSKTKAGNNEPYSFGEFLYDLACNNSDVSLMLSELGEKINKGTVKKEDVLEVITDIHESDLIKDYRIMMSNGSDYSDSDFIENILDFFSVRIEKSMIRQGMINQDNGKNEKINDLKLLIKVAREKDYIIIEDKDVKNTIRNINPESYPKEIKEYVRLIKEDAIKYRFVPKGYDYKRKEQFNSYWDGNFNKKIREYFPVNKVYEYEQFKEFNRELDKFEENSPTMQSTLDLGWFGDRFANKPTLRAIFVGIIESVLLAPISIIDGIEKAVTGKQIGTLGQWFLNKHSKYKNTLDSELKREMEKGLNQVENITIAATITAIISLISAIASGYLGMPSLTNISLFILSVIFGSNILSHSGWNIKNPFAKLDIFNRNLEEVTQYGFKEAKEDAETIKQYVENNWENLKGNNIAKLRALALTNFVINEGKLISFRDKTWTPNTESLEKLIKEIDINDLPNAEDYEKAIKRLKEFTLEKLEEGKELNDKYNKEKEKAEGIKNRLFSDFDELKTDNREGLKTLLIGFFMEDAVNKLENKTNSEIQKIQTQIEGIIIEDEKDKIPYIDYYVDEINELKEFALYILEKEQERRENQEINQNLSNKRNETQKKYELDKVTNKTKDIKTKLSIDELNKLKEDNREGLKTLFSFIINEEYNGLEYEFNFEIQKKKDQIEKIKIEEEKIPYITENNVKEINELKNFALEILETRLNETELDLSLEEISPELREIAHGETGYYSGETYGYFVRRLNYDPYFRYSNDKEKIARNIITAIEELDKNKYGKYDKYINFYKGHILNEVLWDKDKKVSDFGEFGNFLYWEVVFHQRDLYPILNELGEKINNKKATEKDILSTVMNIYEQHLISELNAIEDKSRFGDDDYVNNRYDFAETLRLFFSVQIEKYMIEKGEDKKLIALINLARTKGIIEQNKVLEQEGVKEVKDLLKDINPKDYPEIEEIVKILKEDLEEYHYGSEKVYDYKRLDKLSDYWEQNEEILMKEYKIKDHYELSRKIEKEKSEKEYDLLINKLNGTKYDYSKDKEKLVRNVEAALEALKGEKEGYTVNGLALKNYEELVDLDYIRIFIGEEEIYEALNTLGEKVNNKTAKQEDILLALNKIKEHKIIRELDSVYNRLESARRKKEYDNNLAEQYMKYRNELFAVREQIEILEQKTKLDLSLEDAREEEKPSTLDLGWFGDRFENQPTLRAIFVGIIESVLLAPISIIDGIEKAVTGKQIGTLGQWFLNKHSKYANAVKTIDKTIKEYGSEEKIRDAATIFSQNAYEEKIPTVYLLKIIDSENMNGFTNEYLAEAFDEISKTWGDNESIDHLSALKNYALAKIQKELMERGLTKVENITAVAAIATSISMVSMLLTGTIGYSATDAGIFITAVTFIVNMITHAINNIKNPKAKLDLSITGEKTERLVRRLSDDITNKEETARNVMIAIGEIDKGNYEKEYSQYTEFYKENVFSKTKAGNNEPYSFGEFLYDLACNNSDVSLILSELGEKISNKTVSKQDILEAITDIHESDLIKDYRIMINNGSDYSDSDFIESMLDFFSVRIEKSMIRQGMINQDNGKNEKINDLKLLIKVAREKDYIIIEDEKVKDKIRNINPESYPKEIKEYVRLIKEDAIKYRFVPKGYDYTRKEQFSSYWDGDFNDKIKEYFNKVYEYEQFKEFNRELDRFEGNIEKRERLVRRLSDDITNKEETARNVMIAIGEIDKGNYEKEYSQYTEFYKENVFSKTKAGNNEPYSFGEFLYDLACNNSDVSLILSELGEKISNKTVSKQDILEAITDIHESDLIKDYRIMINNGSDYSDSDFIESMLDFFSVRIEKSMIRQGMINQDNEKVKDLKLLIKVAREKDYIIIEDEKVKDKIRNIKPESYPKEIKEYVRLIKEDAIKYRFVSKGYDYTRKEQFSSYWDGDFNDKIKEYFNKVYEYEQFKEFNRELDRFEGNTPTMQSTLDQDSTEPNVTENIPVKAATEATVKVLSYNELIKELVNSIANAFQEETPDGLVYLAKTAEQAEAANKYIQDNNIEKAIVILIDNEIDENGNLIVKTSKLRGGKLINDNTRSLEKTDEKIVKTIVYTKGEQTQIKLETLAEEAVNNLKGSNPVVNLIDIDTDKKSEEVQKEIIKRTNNAIQTDEYYNGFEVIIDATKEANIKNNIVNWQKMGATVILTKDQIRDNEQKIEETGLQFISEDNIFEFENVTEKDLKTISNSGKKSLKNSRKIVKITGKLPNEQLLQKANAQNIIFALKADKFKSDISNCILITDETTEKDSLQKALNSGMVGGVLTSFDSESINNLTDILTRIADKDFVKNIKGALKIISTMIERTPVQKYERAKNTILKTKIDTGKIVLTNNLQNKDSVLYKLLNQKVSELNELDSKQIDEIKNSIQRIIDNNLFSDSINYSLQMKLDNGEIFEALGEIKGLAMLAMQEIAMEYLTRNGRNETEIRKQLNGEYSQTRDYMAEAMLQFVMNKNGDITQFGKTFKGSANIGKLTPEQLENNVAEMVTSGIPLLEYDNGQVGEYSEERTIENIGKIIYVFDLLLPEFDNMDSNLDMISIRETERILSAA